MRKWLLPGLAALLLLGLLIGVRFALATPAEADVPDDAPRVILSELMSSNDACPNPGGGFDDWIELHNTSGEAVELGGWRLTDREDAAKYTFPQGTRLEAGGYIVVPCRSGGNGEGRAPFGISKAGGETLLLQNEQHITVSSVTTVHLEKNTSLSLDADGVWRATAAYTPGFPNTEEGRAAYLASLTEADPVLILTEVMCDNRATLWDGASFPDWLELTNVSGETVDLSGWYLTDDPERLYDMTLPAASLAPGERLVLRAGTELPFSLSARGEVLTLSTPEGKLACRVECPALPADVSWSLTESGAWAEETDPTPGEANNAEGRLAYLATRTAEDVALNEMMTANDSLLPCGGAYYDWVELRNTGSAPRSLAGLYLTDDADEPRLWALPEITLAPGECFLVYCSGDAALTDGTHCHAPFALNAREDRLYLFDAQGALLDYALLRGIPRRGSMGRVDGEGGFFLFATPSPGQANPSGHREMAASPTADTAQGVYPNTDRLTVTLSGEGELRYTTDGSEPGPDAALYDGPLTFTEPTVLRAAAYADNKLPSPVMTQSYILGEDTAMPVVSLVTDPDNLWSGERGICVYGNHGNFNQDWERDASVALFEPEGGGFSLDCGVKLHGATSRFVTEKKTFKIMFRGVYGANALQYDLFGDGAVTRYGSILIRAGVDEIYPTLVKDSLFGLLAKEGSDAVLSMDSRYCIFYLNGEYWGIYALREAMSEEYYASYYDVSPESVTVTNSSDSTVTSFQELVDFVGSHDLSLDENYAWMEARVDVDSMIDWVIFESYAANNDIWDNLRYYQSTEGDGRWRYALVDLDLTWLSYQKGFEETALMGYHSRLPRAMLENPRFRQRFMERTSELLTGVLSDEHVLETIDGLMEELRPEIPGDRARWGGTLQVWEDLMARVRRVVSDGRAELVARSCVSALGMTPQETEQYFGEVLG